MKMKAFTMAEVLITLSIIGIVAAMTLPSVIQKYKRQEASARLKKFVSTMKQAIILSEIENGSALYWPQKNVIYSDANDGTLDADASIAEIHKFYNLYFKKYLNTITILERDPDVDRYMRVYFEDGSSLQLYNGTCIDMIFDYNGNGNPNERGRDRFVFLLCHADYAFKYHYDKQAFGTYGPGKTTSEPVASREEALQRCKTSGSYCSNLLEFDNWEFKDDYPYQL